MKMNKNPRIYFIDTIIASENRFRPSHGMILSINTELIYVEKDSPTITTCDALRYCMLLDCPFCAIPTTAFIRLTELRYKYVSGYPIYTITIHGQKLYYCPNLTHTSPFPSAPTYCHTYKSIAALSALILKHHSHGNN